MSKFFVLIFLLPSLLFSFELKTRAKAVVLIDQKTGKILFEKNAHQLLSPASTTKVATASYALTLLSEKDFSKLIEATPDALQTVSKNFKKKISYSCKPYLLEPDGTSLDIRKQEKLPIKTLLYGVMMASANDAANVIASYLGGNNIEKFVSNMNNHLKKIGCSKTKFMNPHGLYHPQHQTTAYELALVAKEAMKNPLFRDLVSTMVQIRPKTNKSEERSFYQPNRLLKEGDLFYPNATGIKTGYTKDAGYCLVASAEDKNRSLIAVILGSPSSVERYADVIELFNQAFDEEQKNKKIFDAKETRFKFHHPKACSGLDLYLESDVIANFYPSTKPVFKTEIQYEKAEPPFLKGQKLANVALFMDDEKIGEYPLYAMKDVDLTWNLVVLRFIRSHFIALSFFFFFLNYFIYLIIKYRKNFIGLVISQKFRS